MGKRQKSKKKAPTAVLKTATISAKADKISK